MTSHDVSWHNKVTVIIHNVGLNDISKVTSSPISRMRDCILEFSCILITRHFVMCHEGQCVNSYMCHGVSVEIARYVME